MPQKFDELDANLAKSVNLVKSYHSLKKNSKLKKSLNFKSTAFAVLNREVYITPCLSFRQSEGVLYQLSRLVQL